MARFLRGRPVRAALAAVSGLLLLVPAAAPAAASDPLHLLRPTGRHAVGATSIHLTDTSRPDPWVAGTSARELMVTVWYPTNARRGQRTRYMTPEESKLYLEGKRLTDLPPDILSTVRTTAYADAAPAGRPHSLPLVVLSPGHTQPRNSLSGVAEDLASHGYVVVAIDHTHETYAVTFPDGRIATCAACAVDEAPDFRARQHQVRAADVAYVLDRLTGPDPTWRGSRLIDASRIGMSGASAGGASAIAAMVRDPRIDVGINMDGTNSDVIPAGGLPRPFVFLGVPGVHSPGTGDPTWDRDWDRMTGWKRWLVVAGTQHASFNDISLFADQLDIDFGATTTGTRSMQITRQYTLSVFELQLRQRPQPLLDGPSACYPEVTIAAH